MDLLSDNDYRSLSKALSRMEEIALVRTLGQQKVRASTVTAGNGWPVAMLLRVERWGQWYETQYFESVEEAIRSG